MNRLERFMVKIIPALRATEEREKTTQDVVKKSKDQRKRSEDAVFDAYRKVGIAVSVQSNGRRWDD